MCLGTYFNCIMFMVASSVVTTIMVLNYHHRHKETHTMPGWVDTLFLQYLPWLLMMSRPGKKITRKTIMIQKKLKELDKTEHISKSLLVNVLDMEDNYKSPFHMSHTMPDIADVYRRSSKCPLPSSNDEFSTSTVFQPLQRELNLILREIRVSLTPCHDMTDM